jgi:hypothetical protein
MSVSTALIAQGAMEIAIEIYTGIAERVDLSRTKRPPRLSSLPCQGGDASQPYQAVAQEEQAIVSFLRIVYLRVCDTWAHALTSVDGDTMAPLAKSSHVVCSRPAGVYRIAGIPHGRARHNLPASVSVRAHT